MSIGEVLADARRQAGLSTTEVSRRTKIRESIIKDIERDDYSSSGGDFYARGHIRSIARVIGTDSRPLIEEYDAAQAVPDETLDAMAGRTVDSSRRDGPDEQHVPAAPGGGAARPGPEILGRPAGSATPSPAGPEILGNRAFRRSAPARPGPEILGEPPVPDPPASAHPPIPGEPVVPGDWPVPDEPVVPGRLRVPGEPVVPGGPPVPDDPPAFRDPLVSSAPSAPGDPTLPGVLPVPVSVGSEVTGPPEAAGTGWLSAPAGAGQMEPPTTRMRIDEIDEPVEEAHIPGLTGPPRRARVAGWSVEPPSRRPDQHRRAVAAGLGLAILVTIGIIAYLLTAGLQHASGSPAAASTSRARAHGKHHSHATPPPTPQASHTPTASPSSAPAPATQALAPVRATAFGLGGSPGDDPQGAAAAIDHNPGSRWHTDWYTSAHFGNLYSGTGLLLDMGRAVTITSARITLGSTPGASFQLRVGNVPSLPGLRPVAAASGAGGVVRLQASRPAPARYVLIWFTKLPPDGTGTFQGSVYDISLQGHP